MRPLGAELYASKIISGYVRRSELLRFTRWSAGENRCGSVTFWVYRRIKGAIACFKGAGKNGGVENLEISKSIIEKNRDRSVCPRSTNYHVGEMIAVDIPRFEAQSPEGRRQNNVLTGTGAEFYIDGITNIVGNRSTGMNSSKVGLAVAIEIRNREW